MFKLPGIDLTLSITMNYRIVEASGDRGPYKVKTTAYFYSIADKHAKEILSYQWHPDGKITFPHLHLGSAAKVQYPNFNKFHLPTGRIALEQVLRLAVEEFQAKPVKKHWDKILSEAQKRFETWRTWH